MDSNASQTRNIGARIRIAAGEIASAYKQSEVRRTMTKQFVELLFVAWEARCAEIGADFDMFGTTRIDSVCLVA